MISIPWNERNLSDLGVATRQRNFCDNLEEHFEEVANKIVQAVPQTPSSHCNCDRHNQRVFEARELLNILIKLALNSPNK